MIANLGGCLARVVRRVGLATLVLGFTGGSTLALADGDPGTMLSLGDSVVFGYITQDGPAYLNADNFIGYPEIVGHALRLDVENPSCPGETTAGFLSLNGADNGCRPFRAHFPLHESYNSTQLNFALAYLGAHKRKTRLVTLSLARMFARNSRRYVSSSSEVIPMGVSKCPLRTPRLRPRDGMLTEK